MFRQETEWRKIDYAGVSVVSMTSARHLLTNSGARCASSRNMGQTSHKNKADDF
jgi:hypothetical protein